MAITFMVYDQSAFVSALIYSIHSILIGNNDASTWPIVYELSIPFDSKTVFGWYFLLLFNMCMDLAYLMSFILGTNQFIGSCIYIEAMCEPIDFIMQMIQANVEKNIQETNPSKIQETNIKINAQMCEAIELHMKILE